MAKAGRKHRGYVTSDGRQTIRGLARDVDGRWRIVATGKKFTESDETKAIKKFEELTGAEQLPFFFPLSESKPAHATHRMVRYQVAEEKVAWEWFAEQLVKRPDHAAKMTGIPQLANLHQWGVPKPPLKLTTLLNLYLRNCEATTKTRNEVEATFRWFLRRAGAVMLADLTQDKLIEFRALAVNEFAPATVKLYFSRIRTVLNAAMRAGADVVQISAIKLTMSAVLRPPKNDNVNNPHPISREDFQTLLDNVRKTDTPELWRAMLLMGLNAALYMEDLCGLRWDEIDLVKATYLSRRKKRGRCIRAATLWTETIDALQAVPRRGNSPFVFTSKFGTRYNRNTKINDFKDFRIKAQVPHVRWAHLRDGAYTAACHAQGVEEKYSRLLAGHRSQGLQDRYVQRNPSCVAPACDAVYREYIDASVAGVIKAA